MQVLGGVELEKRIQIQCSLLFYKKRQKAIKGSQSSQSSQSSQAHEAQKRLKQTPYTEDSSITCRINCSMTSSIILDQSARCGDGFSVSGFNTLQRSLASPSSIF